METFETIIPDNEGNHLVVVLYIYDDRDKTLTFQIHDECQELDMTDINIRKLNLDKPLGSGAFFKMNRWLIDQFSMPESFIETTRLR